MNTVIVGAAPAPGAEPFYRALIMSADFLVAADGGGVLCRDAGRLPHLWVGDFDSTPEEAVEEARRLGTEVVRYPTDKDASDLDLALDAARERGPSRVTLTAAFTGRLDHTIAGIGTLFRAVDLAAAGVEPSFTLYPLDASARPALVLRESPGTTVSLFAFERGARVSVSGLRYPLRDAPLPRLSSLGLSNEAVEPEQRVVARAGRVLVIVAREPLTL